MTQIRLICSPGIIRIAVIKEHHLLDFAIWHPGYSDGFGDIYLGKIDSYLPALGGAFVTLGKDYSGFLPDNAGAKGLHEGNWIIARITRSAQGGKGVRLDSRNLPPFPIPENKAPQLLQTGSSPLEELALRWPDAQILSDELAILNLISTAYKSRAYFSQDPIDYEIMEHIESLESGEVILPVGMRANITPTPALTAIDMDIAGNSSDNQNKQRAQFSANQLALPPLLQQLRLRNLSGAIIIDMAGLPIKKRRLFQTEFEKLLQNDPMQPKFLGFTKLGLAEITRPRKRPPLHELLSCDHGQAIHVLNKLEHELQNLAPARHYQSVTLTLSIALYQALQKDLWALNHFKERCAIALFIESNPSFALHQWEYSYD